MTFIAFRNAVNQTIIYIAADHIVALLPVTYQGNLCTAIVTTAGGDPHQLMVLGDPDEVLHSIQAA
jgi:hypothetical protein